MLRFYVTESSYRESIPCGGRAVEYLPFVKHQMSVRNDGPHYQTDISISKIRRSPTIVPIQQLLKLLFKKGAS